MNYMYMHSSIWAMTISRTDTHGDSDIGRKTWRGMRGLEGDKGGGGGKGGGGSKIERKVEYTVDRYPDFERCDSADQVWASFA